MKIKKSIYLSLLLITSLLLQSCVDTALSGAQAVYNRQNLQKTMNDQYITMQATQAIYRDTNRFNNTDVSVTTFNYVVLLTGQVPEAWQRAAIEKIVKNIPEVEQVYNELILAQSASTLTETSDAWITAKIKSQFIASDEIDPGQIKVVTENGTVYLMGLVFPSEAKEAIEIARTTDGVQNVVKVFKYLKINKRM